jgi:hypothetical protein
MITVMVRILLTGVWLFVGSVNLLVKRKPSTTDYLICWGCFVVLLVTNVIEAIAALD